MKSLAKTAIVFALLALVSNAQTNAPTVWTPEVQIKVKTIDAPRVSPDGKRVAYTVANEVMAPDKSEFVTQIWMATTDGKENYQITFGEKSSTNPKWSSDGTMLAFTSTRKENKNNLYLLRLNGGEAEPLTDVKSSVGEFEWSPDGRLLAYTMTDPKTEEEEKNDKGKNDFRWVEENAKMSRLYVIPVEKDASGKREPRKLTTANFTVSNFDWSPDGRQIVFAHAKTPVANDWTTSDVSIVEVASGRVTPFAATPAAENSPVFSPDGKSIAMIVGDNPPRWARSGLITIFSVMGGAPKSLAASYDGQPNIAGWSADGKRIYFSEAKGTGTQVYAIDTAANKIEEIKTTGAVYTAVNLNRSGTMFGFVMQTPDRAPEAFVASVNRFAPVQVSRANADLPKLPLGKTEVIRWKSTDGKRLKAS